MTAAKTWAAAGSAATMLVGGLVLGAPAAVAAPGDAACLQATSQFDAALAGAGITPDAIMSLDGTADAVAAAEAQYTALVVAAGGPSLAELQAAATALAAAQESGDPVALAQAEATVAELDAALAAALGTADPAALEAAVTETGAAFDALLAELVLDEATVNQLLALLEQAVVACEGELGQLPVGTPVTPAPVAPAPVAPVEAAPVVEAPVVEAPAEAAPVAVNPGLNMQTAAAEPAEGPGTGLLAGLFAAGAALSAAVVLRLRRRGRA
ncbi:hypothetical protein GMA12_14355 [Kocuria sediminis]|uniref:Gram-positive cocci surface proteins LPxTG domain-containing protein n=1 Tax=Kocuria sediminis TaxID=1038857 RepID=A0A6N8GTQ9_9MICC|nr:hypothetical protein [Kocuria sediminis]MUN64305.1 hypothetical protein [Kocuria sediminis]